MEIAQLGYQIDSNGALVATKNLDGMTAAASRAETRARDLEAASKRTSTATRRVGMAAVGSSNSLRMASLQLSQVAQQTQATGNFVQSLAIQLPDLALGFGPVAIGASVVAGALLPMAANMLGAGDNSLTLDERLEVLADSMDALTEAQERAGLSLFELRQEYGRLAIAAREVAEAQLDLARNQSLREIRDAITAITSEFGTLEDVVTDTGQTLIDGVAQATRNIQSQLGITEESARLVFDALEDLRDARGPDEQAVALRGVNAALEQAEHGAAEVNSEFNEFSGILLGLEQQVIGFTSSISAAADEAGRLSENLDVASGRGQDPRLFDPENRLSDRFQPDDDLYQDYVRRQRASSRSRGRSGGAARRDPLDDLFLSADRQLADAEFRLAGVDRSRREIAALTAEYRLLEEAKRRDIDLDRTMDETGKTVRDAISEKAAAIGELTGQYADAQDEARRYEETTNEVGQAVSDMILEGESLGDTLESLARSFARATLEASLFGQNGLFGQELLGGVISGAVGSIIPSLPSFDGGGYTGSGSRSGGIDGLGGFPAILHPNETVVDHTRAAAAVTPNVEVHVHNAPAGPPPQVRTSPGRIDIFLGESMSRSVSEGSLDAAMLQRFGLRAKGQL